MRRLVNEIVEHELFVEIDPDKLRGGSLYDVLDTFCEASLDLDVHFHADGLRRLRVNLQPPDQYLGLVGSRTDQELVAFITLFAHDHWRGVLEAKDLGDAFLAVRMGIEDLFDGGGVIVGINVPYLELAVECADKQVIFVDLVEEGRVLVVVDLVLDSPVTRLDVDVADEHLLVVEAADGKDGRRGLEESLGLQFDHSVADTGLWSTDEHWGDRRLGHWLFILLLLFFLLSRLGFRLFLFFFFLTFALGWLDDDRFLLFWLRLQVGQLFCIAVEIEQLRYPVRLAQGGVNVDMAIATPRSEILSL